MLGWAGHSYILKVLQFFLQRLVKIKVGASLVSGGDYLKILLSSPFIGIDKIYFNLQYYVLNYLGCLECVSEKGGTD